MTWHGSSRPLAGPTSDARDTWEWDMLLSYWFIES